MFPTNLNDFKYQQQKLHRQAQHQRLVNSLTQPKSLYRELAAVLGRMLIQAGQLLLNRAEPRNYNTYSI